MRADKSELGVGFKGTQTNGMWFGGGVLCDDPGDSLGKALRHLMKIHLATLR